MSFILDALRKSDAERQRTVAPGLADVRYAARRARRNIWLPILVAVLAANMVFMGWQWFGRGGSGPPAAVPAAVPAAASQPPGGAAEERAPAVSIRPLAREAEFGEPQLEPPVDGDSAAEPQLIESPEPASTAPLPTLAPTTSAAAPATPSRILPDDDLPTVEQAIGSGAANIPMLNLDLHVYSDKAADRFVIINAHKYKEGAHLTEGPTVESITKDGVILSSQGRRFTVSRR